MPSPTRGEGTSASALELTASRSPLDHPSRAQIRDGFRIAPEARHDLVGVLPEVRRRPVFVGLRRLGEIDRLADHADVAELSVPHTPRDPEMLNLRFREGLVDRVDRPR